jgi:hypothetical protein
VTEPTPPGPDRAVDPWEAHRDEQIDAWLRTTPAQRLAWLEDAIAFARHVGAHPRTDDDHGPG